MNKTSLKKLIAEVLHEMETGEDNILPNSSAFDRQKKKETILKFTIGGGLNPARSNSNQIRKLISRMAWLAKKSDLDLIHAEIEKDGKTITDIEPEPLKKTDDEINAELDAMAAGDGAGEVKPGEMPSREQWAKMSPEARDKYVQKGSHEAEWDAATQKDIEDTREKTRKRSALEKSGRLELDPQTGLPSDNTLWTDKEWDQWNNAGDTKQTSTGKYQPSLSKKTAQGKKGAVAGNFTSTLK